MKPQGLSRPEEHLLGRIAGGHIVYSRNLQGSEGFARARRAAHSLETKGLIVLREFEGLRFVAVLKRGEFAELAEEIASDAG